MEPETFPVRAPGIKLGNLIKIHFVMSGGEAKARIQGGEVRVDDEVETRRGRTLRGGEVVELEGEPPVRIAATT